MESQRWLDELQRKLIQRRLPRRYVRRLLRELSDHVLDDKENAMSTDAPRLAQPFERFGSPESIAASAGREYARRTFAARFPLLTFGLLPVLCFPFVAAAIFAGLGWIVAEGLPLLGIGLAEETKEAAWIPLAARVFAASVLILAAGIVIWTSCRMARRSCVSPRWPLASAVLVALLCGCVFSDATPKTREQRGTLSIGLGLPIPRWSGLQTVQLAAPVILGVWLARRRPAGETQPLGC